jgi:hypothetical protein
VQVIRPREPAQAIVPAAPIETIFRVGVVGGSLVDISAATQHVVSPAPVNDRGSVAFEDVVPGTHVGPLDSIGAVVTSAAVNTCSLRERVVTRSAVDATLSYQ